MLGNIYDCSCSSQFLVNGLGKKYNKHMTLNNVGMAQWDDEVDAMRTILS